MNQKISAELDDAFLGQFMQPVIYKSRYFEVDTTQGTDYVPADLVNYGDLIKVGEIKDREDGPSIVGLMTVLEQYTEGSIDNVMLKEGWLARLSAPGYMDCTDWSAHDSEDEAAQYLIDQYGDEYNDE